MCSDLRHYSEKQKVNTVTVKDVSLQQLRGWFPKDMLDWSVVLDWS